MPPPDPIHKGAAAVVSPTVEETLYRAPPVARMRVIAWFSGLVMLGSFWAADGVFGHMTSTHNATELADLPWRITAAATIASLGIGLFGGLLFFLHIYGTRLTLLPDRQTLRLETLTLWGRREKHLPLDLIAGVTYHHGQFSSHRRPTVQVNAPWHWVRLKHGTGFLLDAQGEFISEGRAAQLLPASFQLRSSVTE